MHPIIAAVLAISIVLTSSFVVLNSISSLVERGSAIEAFNDAKYTMSNLRSIINELLIESTESRRDINIDVKGKFTVAGSENRIKYKVYDFSPEPGARTEEDGIQIIYGPTMSAYESDIESNGETDLVLENEFVLFAIRKMNGAINTSDIITLIRNKEMNLNITPTSAVLINDMVNTSYGNGYTELTQQGYDISSSSINLVMSSDAGIDYNATFTLRAGSDFIEMEVAV